MRHYPVTRIQQRLWDPVRTRPVRHLLCTPHLAGPATEGGSMATYRALVPSFFGKMPRQSCSMLRRQDPSALDPAQVLLFSLGCMVSSPLCGPFRPVLRPPSSTSRLVSSYPPIWQQQKSNRTLLLHGFSLGCMV